MKNEIVIAKFTDRVIERYKSMKLPIDKMGTVLFILYSLKDGAYELLDKFDDNSKDRTVLLLYSLLVFYDLIEEKNDGNEPVYKITEKGLSFVESVDEALETEMQEAIKEDVRKIAIAQHASRIEDKEEQGPDKWIDEWIELWPKGKVAGKYLRSNRTECLVKMMSFISTYKFEKNTIFAATKRYLKEQENSQSGHQFTRTSSYFISKGLTKDKVSDLATWCERVGEGVEAQYEEENPFDKLV